MQSLLSEYHTTTMVDMGEAAKAWCSSALGVHIIVVKERMHAVS